jgi:hypothetical protein
MKKPRIKIEQAELNRQVQVRIDKDPRVAALRKRIAAWNLKEDARIQRERDGIKRIKAKMRVLSREYHLLTRKMKTIGRRRRKLREKSG